MVAAMATTAFSFLRTLEELTNHPDVVEEFFYLMGRMMSHCPDPLARSPLLQSLFQCAVVGMQLDHHGANKGTIKFLEHTISYGLSLREQNKPDCQAALEQVLSQEGHSVVANLARAMMVNFQLQQQIPEILWAQSIVPGLLSLWLNAALTPTLRTCQE
jgi:transportin-3